MPFFEYTYLDPNQKKQKGLTEADSLARAQEELLQRGIFLLELTEKVSERKRIFCFKVRQTTSGLPGLIKELALLLKAGIPLYQSLGMLEEQYRGRPLHYLPIGIASKIRNGESFSEAIQAFPRIFEPSYLAMIFAGEAIGNLETALFSIAALGMKKERLQKQLVSALSYPILLFFFSCFVILFFLLGVVPGLQILFEDNPPGGISGIVFGISTSLRKNGIFWLGSFFLIIGSIFLFWRSDKGKQQREKWSLKIPFLKNFLIKFAFARFSRIFGSLLAEGVPLLEAMDIATPVLILSSLKNIFQQAGKKIMEGSSLGKEISLAPLVPILVKGMIALGEETGTLVTVLEHIADIYDEDNNKTIHTFVTWLQPIILIILGGFIGLIMLSVLIPLTNGKFFM
ncbi:type II secretion system F family protein [Candidatus Clavichlamydia salmonicola]|uniref:type II secretion system F family protein n=1 Tax=Candidatus Clavichlamydia salmonicola TaxID=469812 RepID=UPI001891DA5C|nr:type II secretion system F family protein [Candidatus Clavichlamydia salmonicola]